MKKFQYILLILFLWIRFWCCFGCPGHDQRDLDFALKYKLPVKTVVRPNEKDNFKGKRYRLHRARVIINSKFLNNLKVPDESIIETIKIIEKKRLEINN